MYSLLTHSNFSFLQGASHPHELIEASIGKGYKGIALTDFDGVYGIVKAYMASKDTDITLFYGAEVHLDFGEFPDFKLPSGKIYGPSEDLPVFLQNRLAVIAKKKDSYTELCRLLSYVHRDGKKATPLSPSDKTAPWPENTAFILPMRGLSQLFSPKNKNVFNTWLEEIKELQTKCPDLYLALTPPTSALEQNAYLNHLQAHKLLEIPVVATPDVFFHSRERKKLHDTLTSVRLNEPMPKARWAFFANEERSFNEKKSFHQFFSKNETHKTALKNNSKIASEINFSLSELRYHYPSEFIPKEFTAQSFLIHLVEEGKKVFYPGGVPEKVEQALAKEISLIEELKFADYFLTVWDIVRFARSENILCQGRGSAANSAVCYVLGVTAVDPAQYDLLFERFISRERGEPPDIDVDFEHERREEVIQYIYSRYGRTRAAMVANVIAFQTRGCLRAVGKTLGFKESELSTILSGMKDRFGHHRTYEEIIAEGALKEKTPLSPEAVASWAQTSRDLHHFPRHLGLHSGGFVVSQFPLTDISPIEPATMENRSVIQWNKDDLDDLGMFKIDVLSLGMLTAIRKTFEYLRAHKKFVPGTLLPVSLHSIPPDCKKTYDMICDAKTVGVFQIESRAQMSMLPRLKPRKLYDLVIEVAIIRPGPIVGGIVHPYLKRRAGLEPIVFADPRLEPILKHTLGVPIFQEQVMRVAIAIGNFTPGEADQLRKAMGAWKIRGNMQGFDKKLKEGMKQNGIPEVFAKQILGQLEGFSEYGFPESHAISFAMIAYASSYLKAQFPAYFLCGLINSQPLGFYSTHSLIQEALHEGVSVLPIDILESEWDSKMTPSGAVRLGFRLVHPINQEHADAFVERRKKLGEDPSLQGILIAFEEFFSHEQVSLVMANAFQSFDENRRNILWYIIAKPSKLLNDVESVHFQPKPKLFEAWDNAQDDFKFTHTSLGPHPLHLIKEIAWPYEINPALLTLSKNLNELPANATVTVAGLAVVRQSPPTAKGMVFITLEDEWGNMNLIIQPPIYTKFRSEILRGDLLCVKGTRQVNGKQSTILVKHIYAFDEKVQKTSLLPYADFPGR